MSVLELKDLTTLMLERLAGIRIETEAERELREFREARMMPFYTLTIVSLNSAEKSICQLMRKSFATSRLFGRNSRSLALNGRIRIIAAM